MKKLIDTALIDTARIKRVMVEKHNVAFRRHFSREMIDTAVLKCVEDDAADRILLELRTFFYRTCAAEDVEWETVPATWWDHFKRDWCGGILRKWFPYNSTEILVRKEYYKVCPHLEVGYRENPKVHLEWLVQPEWVSDKNWGK